MYLRKAALPGAGESKTACSAWDWSAAQLNTSTALNMNPFFCGLCSQEGRQGASGWVLLLLCHEADGPQLRHPAGLDQGIHMLRWVHVCS
jgi:hypothetical protein